jgi:hypothetical protein
MALGTIWRSFAGFAEIDGVLDRRRVNYCQ